MTFIGLTYVPLLLKAYNYLAGVRSPIDQAAWALLGSDGARLVVTLSCIVGAIVGFVLSRVVTTKLDMTRIEGEAELEHGYPVLLFGGAVLFCIFPVITLIDISSMFLANMGVYMTAGWFFGYIIPVLLKYTFLLLHARSINSHIELVGPSGRSGMWRRLGLMRLRVVRNEFEWW